MDDHQFRTLIVDATRRWIGTPYCHQASVRGAGADCLGLVRGVWRELLGEEPWDLPPYSSDWDVEDGDILKINTGQVLAEVDGSEATSGDVVLFRMPKRGSAKHLGILTGTEAGLPSFVHSYSMYGVVETTMTAAWSRRVDSYYSIPFRSASWQR